MTLTCLNQLRMHLLQHAAWLGTLTVVKGYGRCCHENYRAHMCILDVTLTTTVQRNIDEGLSLV